MSFDFKPDCPEEIQLALNRVYEEFLLFERRYRIAITIDELRFETSKQRKFGRLDHIPSDIAKVLFEDCTMIVWRIWEESKRSDIFSLQTIRKSRKFGEICKNTPIIHIKFRKIRNGNFESYSISGVEAFCKFTKICRDFKGSADFKNLDRYRHAFIAHCFSRQAQEKENLKYPFHFLRRAMNDSRIALNIAISALTTTNVAFEMWDEDISNDIDIFVRKYLRCNPT